MGAESEAQVARGTRWAPNVEDACWTRVQGGLQVQVLLSTLPAVTLPQPQFITCKVGLKHTGYLARRPGGLHLVQSSRRWSQLTVISEK